MGEAGQPASPRGITPRMSSPARKPRTAAVVALVALVPAAAGCGSGHAKPSASQAATAQLRVMVLPRSALSLPASVRVPSPAGFFTNAQAAAHNPDPRITDALLTNDGRLSGYVLGYSLSQSRTQKAFLNGAGLFRIVTEVDLYRDAKGPTTRLMQGVSDLRGLTGRPLKLHTRLDRFETFPVRGIGDAAVGLRYVIEGQGVHIYFTQVGFRRGRRLASTIEERADAKNVDAAVTSLAHSLDQRIQGVLSGKIRTTGS
jgi:hypothetical protein